MTPEGIDVIVTLYDTAELPCFAQCLFSLLGQAPSATGSQSHGGLRLHAMLQRFSITDMQAVRHATKDMLLLDEGASLTLHNWDYPEPFDLRVPLLNWGLEVAQGRYVTCVGSNDRVLAGTYAKLLSRLQATQAAIALGGAAAQAACWWGDVILPLPRDPGTSLPGIALAPVFLLDRTRLTSRDLVFRSGEPDQEINEFVSRLDRRGATDIACLTEVQVLRQNVGA